MSRIGQDSYSRGGNEEDISEQDRKTYAIALEVFDTRIVSSIVSRDLQDRLYAIEYVKEFMENENYQDDTDLACDKVRANSYDECLKGIHVWLVLIQNNVVKNCRHFCQVELSRF